MGLNRQCSIGGDCHVMSETEVLANYGGCSRSGLSSSEVPGLRLRFGRNELKEEPSKSLFSLVLEQFDDLLVKILLLAAVISFGLAAVGDGIYPDGTNLDLTAFVEPVVILCILILNAIVGVWQESNAEEALEALKKLQPEHATCLRDGVWQILDAADLVPGDIVDVRTGDKVAADMRILQLKTTTLRAEQSQLTGESKSVEKLPVTLGSNYDNCEIQAKINCLFSSTTIANGHAICCVTSIGMKTEIGKIQAAVQKAGKEENPTPLQLKLEEFGVTLSRVIFFICVVVWLINYKNFSDPIHGSLLRGCIYYFKIAVALAVAAIPEGLPAVITTCLALGTRKMAKDNAIVRRLPSIETLGCTTVICSDKTGTLTTNEMCCVKMVIPSDSATVCESFKIQGHSYAPTGVIAKACVDGETQVLKNIGKNDVALQHLAQCGSLCNEARLQIVDNKYERQGEPTEAAIRVLIEKLGCPEARLNDLYLNKDRRKHKSLVARNDENAAEIFNDFWASKRTKLATLEFTRERKSMSVLCSDDVGTLLYVKGAPESILDRCSSYMTPTGEVKCLSEEFISSVNKQISAMGSESLRTMAFALRRFESGHPLATYDGTKHKGHGLISDPAKLHLVEEDMTFIGLLGIIDPPRPEVADALKLCRKAGIRVIMITGDNKQTAEAIAAQVGIMSVEEIRTRSFTGKEFEAMSHEQQKSLLKNGAGVFSRTEPKHKQIIVKILKELGEVCAMTGDGVNDAPALKQADIGISMGITGTEVAKQASDMILADDNFSTIVKAVEEGRSIFNNMKAFIRYLISSNIGEVASIFLTSALGIPEGLAPVQLLWVNLVTDGPPATALGFNPPDVDVMERPPRNRNDPLISLWVFIRYMVIGVYVGVATVGIFINWYLFSFHDDNHTPISFYQLSNWAECPTWNNFNVNPVYGMDPTDPCTYFTSGKIKPCTLSLTVLVVIEMLNALNALSENGSLLQMPPWANPWLIIATLTSLLVHCAILYIPIFASIFVVVPLSLQDWIVVFAWSMPVIFIDEILKLFARRATAPQIPAVTTSKKQS